MPVTLDQLQPSDIWNAADNVKRFLLLAAYCNDELTLGEMQALALQPYDNQPTELKIGIHQCLLDERKKG